MESARTVYSITDLTRLIRVQLERTFGEVWVEGEVSNVRRPTSGHYYFTIKDANAQISAVMFRGNQSGLRFVLKDGVQVRCFGQVTVYEKGGNYQIVVRQAEEAGKGDLQARFEALKERLRKEGLFDEARKKPLPLLPRHIGVVTSPTGAALQDILKVMHRRFPNVHLVLAPVKVQGEGAAEEIAEGIDLLNRLATVEVIIVGRGGGSLEDLWAFNEEVVARAIARSNVPVISAVGHEIDFTIADFVADVRAPTPSAAAEMVVGCKESFEERLDVARRRLASCLAQRVLRARNRLLHVAGCRVLNQPSAVVAQQTQRLDDLRMRMAHTVSGRVGEGRQWLADHSHRLLHAVRLRQQACRHRLVAQEGQFRALSPLAVLSRGYSVTRTATGRVVRSCRDVAVGVEMETVVADGRLRSVVRECQACNGQADAIEGDRALRTGGPRTPVQ